MEELIPLHPSIGAGMGLNGQNSLDEYISRAHGKGLDLMNGCHQQEE